MKSTKNTVEWGSALLCRWFLSVFLLLCSIFSYVKSSSLEDTLKTYVSEILGIQFSFPERFLVGSYDSTNDFTGTFRRHIVLVEPRELGNRSRAAIPIGKVPTISVGIEPISKGRILEPFTKIEIVKKFFSKEVTEREFKISLGSHTAYRLPGYPGPHGNLMSYYLVPFPDGRYVEIMAHRRYFRKSTGVMEAYSETHYDEVIEKIIESMKPLSALEDSILVAFGYSSGHWIEAFPELLESDHGDVAIESSMQNGRIFAIHANLDNDGIPEYFVRSLCGNGGCEYPIFDGRSRRFLGSVFGSEVWIVRDSSQERHIIETLSFVSAEEGQISRYQFSGTQYRLLSSRPVKRGKETDRVYEMLRKAPRIE